MLRNKVLDGSYQLNAALAKFLRLPWPAIGALLADPSTRQTVAYGKSSDDLRAEAQALELRAEHLALLGRPMAGGRH